MRYQTFPEPIAESESDSLPYRPTTAVSSYAQTLRRLPPRGLGSFNSRTRNKQGVVTGNAATKHTALVQKEVPRSPARKERPNQSLSAPQMGIVPLPCFWLALGETVARTKLRDRCTQTNRASFPYERRHGFKDSRIGSSFPIRSGTAIG